MIRYLIFIVCCFLCVSAVAAPIDKDTEWVTYSGSINAEGYLNFKAAIEQTPRLKGVVFNSMGGDMGAAIAIGKIIKAKKLIVKVESACFSACANYIFIAGRKKILSKSAVVFFHGGIQQEGLFQAVKSTNLGEKSNTHGATYTEDGKGAPPDYILSAIGMEKISSGVEAFPYLVKLEKKYFLEMNVNNELPTFGQKGKYKKIWSSKNFEGFYYDLESLRKMGVNNVEIEGGEWHPEANELFSQMYVVKYP